MNTEPSFLIPIIGLKVGTHKFQFDVNQHFVNKYEDSELDNADISCVVEMYISTGHIEMKVLVNGSISVPCDRCLTQIDLPINGEYDVLVKYAEETKEEDEVIYLSRDEANLDIEKCLYDLIRLTLPLVNVYDCDLEEDPPCDEIILSKLNPDIADVPEIEQENQNIWESLKKNLKK